MRRLIISLVMLAGILFLSAFNLYTLYQIRGELVGDLDAMMQKLEQGQDPTAVTMDALEFEELWLDREEKLVKFIRHADLEQITWDSARLPYLARYGDLSELAAEINRIRLQVNHLWESQFPRWRTVF